jgi:hypothetical protein
LWKTDVEKGLSTSKKPLKTTGSVVGKLLIDSRGLGVFGPGDPPF